MAFFSKEALRLIEEEYQAELRRQGAHAGNAATWLQWKRFLIEKERAERDANRRGKP